jgi:NADP-dependent 3-hydroxy acid dehydrogenase YdfG
VELRGSVVVVTGASSGFGELAALRFGRAGARVVLAARRLDRLEALAERIASEGGLAALAVRCDVTDLEELTALRDRVRRRSSGATSWSTTRASAAAGPSKPRTSST